MITLKLPFPDSKLNPNKRFCWQSKIKTKNSQRDAGYIAALPYRGQLVHGKIAISLMFIPATRHRYDLDNLLAGAKAAIDGVALGLGINDRQFRPITIDIGEPQKDNPRTLLTIY